MEVKQMNRNNMSTTTKRMVLVAIFGTIALALLPTIASAHGGEEHVTGTVTAVSDTIHAVEVNEKLVAHTVEIGAATVAKH
jgi:hypothetical protein